MPTSADIDRASALEAIDGRREQADGDLGLARVELVTQALVEPGLGDADIRAFCQFRS
jgi:hypothetical protein